MLHPYIKSATALTDSTPTLSNLTLTKFGHYCSSELKLIYMKYEVIVVIYISNYLLMSVPLI